MNATAWGSTVSLRAQVGEPIRYWYDGGEEETEDVYPVIFRLPAGRGYLAGACDITCLLREIPDYTVIDRCREASEDEAWRAAKAMADRCAHDLAEDGQRWLDAYAMGREAGETGGEADPPSDDHFSERYQEGYEDGQATLETQYSAMMRHRKSVTNNGGN